MRGKIRTPRGQGPVMEVIRRVIFKSKKNHNLRSDSPTKLLLISQRLTMIRRQNLSIKEEKVVHKVGNQIFPNIARGTWVDV